MSKIERCIEFINKDAMNRHKEVSYMFTKLSQITEPVDKYFYARSVVVFTYGTLEKYVKNLSEIALDVALENRYFNENYVQELMQILKYDSKPKVTFDLLMHHKNIYLSDQPFEIRIDQGYFSRNGRIDSVTIAHIVNVLNLNKKVPNIRIPKISIDTLSSKRMMLAHGDYINELNRFGPSRVNLTIEEVNDFIVNEFRLTDTTRTDIVTFIDEFRNKIIVFLEEIALYLNI